MGLNEFGDFLAGVFGPLMLFWLILGYIQQQKELQQNTKALELQADELRKSVDQHKELVKATREQVETEREVLELEHRRTLREGHPSFSLTKSGWSMRSGSGDYTYSFMVLNSGQAASNVAFEFLPNIESIRSPTIVNYFEKGKSQELKWNWDTAKAGEAPDALQLTIICRDANQQEYKKEFSFRINEDKNYVLS